MAEQKERFRLSAHERPSRMVRIQGAMSDGPEFLPAPKTKITKGGVMLMVLAGMLICFLALLWGTDSHLLRNIAKAIIPGY